MFNWNFFYFKEDIEAKDVKETELFISSLDLANKKIIATNKIIEAFEVDKNLNMKFKNLPEKYINSQSAKVHFKRLFLIK